MARSIDRSPRGRPPALDFARPRRGASSTIAFVLVATWAAAPTVSAEIFKCSEKNGVVRYQNFPCPIDSLGSAPQAATAAKPPAPSTAGEPRLNPAASEQPPTGVLASMKEPRAGMSQEEVRAIWGEPEEVTQDEPRTGPRVEIWDYGNGRSVTFNNKHRVMSVRR